MTAARASRNPPPTQNKASHCSGSRPRRRHRNPCRRALLARLDQRALRLAARHFGDEHEVAQHRRQPHRYRRRACRQASHVRRVAKDRQADERPRVAVVESAHVRDRRELTGRDRNGSTVGKDLQVMRETLGRVFEIPPQGFVWSIEKGQQRPVGGIHRPLVEGKGGQVKRDAQRERTVFGECQPGLHHPAGVRRRRPRRTGDEQQHGKAGGPAGDVKAPHSAPFNLAYNAVTSCGLRASDQTETSLRSASITRILSQGSSGRTRTTGSSSASFTARVPISRAFL